MTALYRELPDRVPLEVKRIANELVNKAMPETVRLLNERWSEVEAVTSLLLKHTVRRNCVRHRRASQESAADVLCKAADCFIAERQLIYFPLGSV